MVVKKFVKSVSKRPNFVVFATVLAIFITATVFSIKTTHTRIVMTYNYAYYGSFDSLKYFPVVLNKSLFTNQTLGIMVDANVKHYIGFNVNKSYMFNDELTTRNSTIRANLENYTFYERRYYPIDVPNELQLTNFYFVQSVSANTYITLGWTFNTTLKINTRYYNVYYHVQVFNTRYGVMAEDFVHDKTYHEVNETYTVVFGGRITLFVVDTYTAPIYVVQQLKVQNVSVYMNLTNAYVYTVSTVKHPKIVSFTDIELIQSNKTYLVGNTKRIYGTGSSNFQTYDYVSIGARSDIDSLRLNAGHSITFNEYIGNYSISLFSCGIFYPLSVGEESYIVPTADKMTNFGLLAVENLTTNEWYLSNGSLTYDLVPVEFDEIYYELYMSDDSIIIYTTVDILMFDVMITYGKLEVEEYLDYWWR